MNKIEFIDSLKNINGIVSICRFGSYGTKEWIRDRRDIDLAIVVDFNVSFMDTVNIEDELNTLYMDFYKYNKIHLTFVHYSDFYKKFARIVVDSDEQYSYFGWVIDESIL